MINSGNVKLAAITDEIYMDSLVAAGIIGIVGGAIGSLFIRVNNKVNILRKKMLGTSRPRKILEACILVTVTVTVFFISAYFRNCVDAADPNDVLVKNKIDVKQFNCPDG